VVWPLSIVLYGETVNAPALIGSAVVLVGLAASGFGAPNAQATPTFNARAALGWALLCAASIAGYHLMYKAALREAVNPSACFALSLALSALINFARLDAAGRAALVPLVRARGARLLIMGALCGGSFLILMEALARGGSGFVLTLRNTSVLFAAALAWLIRERPTRLELAGAALVALGAALMAWP
jgi:drug/metabolite transporter (DMT)-like permease